MNLPERKESPIMGTTGMGGGAGSALVSRFVTPPGQVVFDDHPGGADQSWTVPPGVEYISIVCVGGGAGADGGNNGGGGGLSWINTVPVVPGTNLTVRNGKTGSRFGSGNPSGSDTNGQDSYVNDANGATILIARGGNKDGSNNGGNGGNDLGNRGGNYSSLTFGGGRGGHGNAGSSGKGGGGGAGGYSGNGGNGGSQCNNGSDGLGGGAGGGGGNCTQDGGQGGGTGLLGEGSGGTGGQNSNYGLPGTGGSGGTAGNNSYGNWTTESANYGGGCGAGSGGAGRGAVRIIWPGDERYFPNTNTGDV